MAHQRNGGKKTLILCGDLVKAVRSESARAIQHYWGVKDDTVGTWRKALGVENNNAGTRALRSRQWQIGGVGEATRPGPGLEASFHSPERAAKIASAKRGKPQTPHIAEMLRRARLGIKHTAETRRKMSEAAKNQGRRIRYGRPFTADEDALIGRMPDAEVAKQTGRHPATVWVRRMRLGIESFRRKSGDGERPQSIQALTRLTQDNARPTVVQAVGWVW
jgi:hypothetical protein